MSEAFREIIPSAPHTVILVLDNSGLIGERVDLLNPLDEIPDFRLCYLCMMGVVSHRHGLRTFDPARSIVVVTDIQVGRWVSNHVGMACRLSEGQDIAPFCPNCLLQ